jgi:hypothetical protein
LPGGSEENHENFLAKIAGVSGEIRTGHLPNTFQKLCRLNQPACKEENKKNYLIIQNLIGRKAIIP